MTIRTATALIAAYMKLCGFYDWLDLLPLLHPFRVIKSWYKYPGVRIVLANELSSICGYKNVYRKIN